MKTFRIFQLVVMHFFSAYSVTNQLGFVCLALTPHILSEANGWPSNAILNWFLATWACTVLNTVFNTRDFDAMNTTPPLSIKVTSEQLAYLLLAVRQQFVSWGGCRFLFHPIHVPAIWKYIMPVVINYHGNFDQTSRSHLFIYFSIWLK